VDTADSEEQILKSLGSAAAHYLESTLTGGDKIGISSWSATLLSTVEAMRPKVSKVADEVVQVIGGVGESNAQAHAVRLAGRLAEVTGAGCFVFACTWFGEHSRSCTCLICKSKYFISS